MLKVKSSTIIAFLLLLSFQLLSQKIKIFKPAKFVFHKTTVKQLFSKYDSLTTRKYLHIGLTDDPNIIHIYSNEKGELFDKYIHLQRDSIISVCNEINLNHIAFTEILRLLQRTKMNSITSSFENGSKTIELSISHTFFSDNCKGIIYLPDFNSHSFLPANSKKISKNIFFNKHISC